MAPDAQQKRLAAYLDGLAQAAGHADRQYRGLFGRGRGHTAQADLATIGGGQDDVGTLHGGQQGEQEGRRQRTLLSLQQVLHPQRVAEKGHQDMRFDARFELVE